MSVEKYQTLYRELRAELENGRLPVGARISEVRLAAERKISRNTLRRATALLERYGFLRRINGSGVVVTDFRANRGKILFIASLSDRKSVGSVIHKALIKEAHEFNLEFIHCESRKFRFMSETDLTSLRQTHVFSGVLMVGSLQKPDDPFVVRLNSFNLPVVLLSALPDDRSGTGFATVGIDVHASVAVAVAALRKAGHRRILTVGGDVEMFRGFSIHEYQRLLDWNAIDSAPEYYIPCSWEEVESRILRAFRILNVSAFPSAVLCYSHGHAVQIDAALRKIGIPLPLVELFPEPEEHFQGAAAADYDEMVRKSVELLECSENWYGVERAKTPPPHIVIKPRFVVNPSFSIRKG